MPSLSDRMNQALVVLTEESNLHFLIIRTCLDYLIGGAHLHCLNVFAV